MPLLRVLLGHPPHGFLGFARALLQFALDLLSRVATGGADDVIGFAFELLGLAGGDIFTAHMFLLKWDRMNRASGEQRACRILAAPESADWYTENGSPMRDQCAALRLAC